MHGSRMGKNERKSESLVCKEGYGCLVYALTLVIGKLGNAAKGCRGLCIYEPRLTMRHFAPFEKLGMLWCSGCEIAIKTIQCPCCHQKGRLKARHRKRLSSPKTVFVEDAEDGQQEDEISVSDQESKRQTSKRTRYSPNEAGTSPVFRISADQETKPKICNRAGDWEIPIFRRVSSWKDLDH